MTAKVFLALHLSVALLMALSLWGCRSNNVYFSLKKDQSIVKIKKVGVLPFINESGRRGAREIVTNTFLAETFKTGKFFVEEKGNIEQFLLREKVKIEKWVDQEHLIKLGKRLNVDAVFTGTVEKFAGGDRGENLPIPEVCIRAKLIDVKDGMVLWMARHCRTGNDFIILFDIGQVRNVGTLTKIVISEMLDTMF